MVGIVSGIVLVRLLTKEDLATYRQTMLAYYFAAPFLTLALPSALYFFLPRKPGSERTVLVSNLIPLAAMGILFSVILLSGGARLLAWRFHNPGLEHTLRLLALYPVFALPMAALEACLVARNHIGSLTFFNVLSRILLTVGLIVVCVCTRRPEALVLTQVVVAGILVVPALSLMWRACAAGDAKPDQDLMWEMAKYSVPLGLASMLGTMTLQLSSVIVSSMCDPADFAVYSVGAFELPLIGIITGSITTVILADMSRLCHEGRKDEALRLFKIGAQRSAAILLPAMVFFLIVAEPFILALYSDKYLLSVLPFRLYLLMLPIRIVTYGSALMALGMTRTVLFRSIVDLVLNTILCAIMVHYVGYIGGVLGMLIMMYAWHAPYNLISIARGFGVTFAKALPYSRLILIMGYAVLFALPAWGVLHLYKFGPITGVAAAGIIFWPGCLYLLHRQGHLPMPAEFADLILRAKRFCLGKA